MKDNGIIIYENFLVKPEGAKAKLYGIPAIKEANKMGRKVVANVILMGALQELTDTVSKENLEKALLERVPNGTEELNLAALRKGYEIAQQMKNGGIN